jgi:hypothetical protein
MRSGNPNAPQPDRGPGSTQGASLRCDGMGRVDDEPNGTRPGPPVKVPRVPGGRRPIKVMVTAAEHAEVVRRAAAVGERGVSVPRLLLKAAWR